MVEFSIRVKILGNRLSDVSVGDEVNRQIGTAMVLASGGMNTDPTNIHDQTCFEPQRRADRQRWKQCRKLPSKFC